MGKANNKQANTKTTLKQHKQKQTAKATNNKNKHNNTDKTQK